jgi:hypothetical protein
MDSIANQIAQLATAFKNATGLSHMTVSRDVFTDLLYEVSDYIVANGGPYGENRLAYSLPDCLLIEGVMISPARL